MALLVSQQGVAGGLVKRGLRLALFAAALLTAQTRPPGASDLIVPGLRVGPVTRTSTERSLRQSLGAAAVKQDIDVGEGILEPGLVIYKDDPTRRLAVVWNREQPAHPASILICYPEGGSACRWHTGSGIGLGTTLKDLERRNGKPFQMTVWGSDVGGNVVSYEGGRLERELRSLGALALTLVPLIGSDGAYLPTLTSDEMDAVTGEKFVSSRNAVLQKLDPYVAAMSLEFPR
jgi:hypothetical protein